MNPNCRGFFSVSKSFVAASVAKGITSSTHSSLLYRCMRHWSSDGQTKSDPLSLFFFETITITLYPYFIAGNFWWATTWTWFKVSLVLGGHYWDSKAIDEGSTSCGTYLPSGQIVFLLNKVLLKESINRLKKWWAI